MIGWIQLSRQAVARAAEALANGDRGVRDEVGFLSIHQAIADRLFPGTSVLHTRARYALLVPWLMELVAKSGSEGDLERRLLHAEGALAGQFVLGKAQGLDTDGAIGTEVWVQRRRPPVQPPSFSYWSALREWGILLRNADGTTPRRREVLRHLARKGGGRRMSEDDPDPRAGGQAPFVQLPPAPTALGKNTVGIDLTMTPEERRFLRRQLVGVLRSDGKQSLLACLAEAGAGGKATAPWTGSVLSVADASDREILRVAQQAAALAAIGRAVYAALVEDAWNSDRNGTQHVQADALAQACHEHGPLGRQLEVDQLLRLFPKLPTDLVDLLRLTQAWLRKEVSSPQQLRECYAAAEWSRKDTRSKLTTRFSGRRRRDEWIPEKHPAPSPLGYRWRNVSRLLQDIAG
jgi:hypothetical protein